MKWADEEIQKLKELYPKKGALYCSNLLNRGQNSIITKASRLKIKRPLCYLQKRMKNNVSKYIRQKRKLEDKINIKNYFNINTKEKAYVFGLLWGDGNLSKGYNKNDKYIGFTMIFTDFIEVKKYFNSFCRDRKWKFYIRNRIGNRNYKKSVSCGLYDKFLSKFLILLDFDKKSYVRIKKVLNYFCGKNKNLLRYFWRGYLDADGCFFYNKKGYSHRLNFSSTYNQNWSDHIKYMKKKIGIRSCKSYKRINKIGNRNSCLEIGPILDIIKFGNYIYDGYEYDQIGLKRKYKKFLKIKNSKHQI